MIEWLTLALIAPVVIAPVVLLAGFAGCKFEGHGQPIPSITEAVGTGATRIELTVSYPTPVLGFEIERRTLADRPETPFTVDATTVDTFETIDGSTSRIIDRDLLPQTTYYYSVRAIKIDGQPSAWSASADSSFVPASTHNYMTAFEWTPGEIAAVRDSMGWEGYMFVQRFAAGRLARSGEYVRLSLRSASASGASIAKIYISQADGAAGADPYDSAADLTELTSTPFDIPSNATGTTPAVRYRLDESWPLLVIIEFRQSPPSSIRVVDAAQAGDGVLYFKQTVGEAALRNRTGYTSGPVDAIGLIEKIEVA